MDTSNEDWFVRDLVSSFFSASHLTAFFYHSSTARGEKLKIFDLRKEEEDYLNMSVKNHYFIDKRVLRSIDKRSAIILIK